METMHMRFSIFVVAVVQYLFKERIIFVVVQSLGHV